MSINLPVFTLMSSWLASILLEILFPNCFNWSTQGRRLPHSCNPGSFFCFLSEGHQLCSALNRIRISWTLKVVGGCKILTRGEHVLYIEGGSCHHYIRKFHGNYQETILQISFSSGWQTVLHNRSSRLSLTTLHPSCNHWSLFHLAFAVSFILRAFRAFSRVQELELIVHPRLFICAFLLQKHI